MHLRLSSVKEVIPPRQLMSLMRGLHRRCSLKRQPESEESGDTSSSSYLQRRGGVTHETVRCKSGIAMDELDKSKSKCS